uniref:(California timema) hypothetical protein n=1 Tax=Timema californicum TaxID=61474 RepID=A0A7R9P8R2_TIMCA|nr:unnamed protein product [Timema californicum]
MIRSKETEFIKFFGGSDNFVWPCGTSFVSGRPRIEPRAVSRSKAPLSQLRQLESEELHRRQQRVYLQELSILSLCGTLLQHWVLKPPYAIQELSTAARKKADYNVNNLHGTPWDSGDVNYSLFEYLISSATKRAETVYVKGAEKKKFLVKYTSTPVVDLYDKGCPSLKTLKLGRTICMAHSSVWNFCSASIVWGLLDWMIEDGHAHHKTCAENKPVVPFCTGRPGGEPTIIMEAQDVCTREAKPVKPLAITGIFNTLFPLDEVAAKRVIVGMSVKNTFTPYVQLEKCGSGKNWAAKSVISKFFTNTQPPQKITLTNHEISLRFMCGHRMVVISEKKDAGLRWVAYLAPSWSHLCDVWDLINVAVDRRDMWSTPAAHYCNDLIDSLVDMCDTLTESAVRPRTAYGGNAQYLVSATYYTRQVVGLDYYMLDCELKTILLTHLRDTVEKRMFKVILFWLITPTTVEIPTSLGACLLIVGDIIRKGLYFRNAGSPTTVSYGSVDREKDPSLQRNSLRELEGASSRPRSRSHRCSFLLERHLICVLLGSESGSPKDYT